MHLNIRWRLTLWNTLALACVLLLFGGMVYWLMQRTRQRIDHQGNRTTFLTVEF